MRNPVFFSLDSCFCRNDSQRQIKKRTVSAPKYRDRNSQEITLNECYFFFVAFFFVAFFFAAAFFLAAIFFTPFLLPLSGNNFIVSQQAKSFWWLKVFLTGDHQFFSWFYILIHTLLYNEFLCRIFFPCLQDFF